MERKARPPHKGDKSSRPTRGKQENFRKGRKQPRDLGRKEKAFAKSFSFRGGWFGARREREGGGPVRRMGGKGPSFLERQGIVSPLKSILGGKHSLGSPNSLYEKRIGDGRTVQQLEKKKKEKGSSVHMEGRAKIGESFGRRKTSVPNLGKRKGDK